MMPQFNYDQARFNMVEQQIRPWEVLDQRVLDQMSQIPREKFVPLEYQRLAFADFNIPLAYDQVMMSPKQEARMLQALRITPQDRILEIGTGSGFVTALLAYLGYYVDSVEIFEELTRAAAHKISAFTDRSNIALEIGDAINGYNLTKEYDVILLTGSVPVLQPHFQQQLTIGGRLFAIVGEEPVMEAIRLTRLSETEWLTDSLFESNLPPLVGAPQSSRFLL